MENLKRSTFPAKRRARRKPRPHLPFFPKRFCSMLLLTLLFVFKSSKERGLGRA